MSATDHDSPFDYIVVGGGTAGLVVATRLSEDSNVRVLVVEAGADRSVDPLILTPGLIAGAYGKDEYDWNFLSTPQSTLNNRQINQARGKCLGGSSAINFLMTVYPSRANIDMWAKMGNKGWDFDGLAPYFAKAITVHTPSLPTKDICQMAYHDESLKGEGPVDVSFGDGYGPMNTAWMETFAKLGLKATADPRSGKAIGAFQNGTTINPETKTRSYAHTAYLTPGVMKRENLAVVTETLVKKVLLERKGVDVVATGIVALDKNGNEKTFKTNREVILSAGALQSPQMLELSGIGSKALLESHGIPMVVENPHVGEHMQDHPIVCQSFEVNPDIPSGDVLRDTSILNALVQQYMTNREGPLGQSNISVAYSPLSDKDGPLSDEAKKAFLDESLPKADADQNHPATEKETALLRDLVMQHDEPNAQYLLFPSQVTITDKPAAMSEYILPSRPENYITIMTILNHPFSRGSCHITSADPTVKPEWNPRFNANPADMEILARNVQFVDNIVSTEPFSQIFKKDGKRQPEIKADTLEKARDIVRQRQISVFHVSSSCAMLPKELGGVVDERLNVYGTKGLRVVDASVIPIEPLGNIQSTVYALAEKAADLIKEDRK
ncbi:GMC oxidoreductase [Zalerion maritima]|uniref:GMC oxidoreductase n=1 Tax=Zalerion maritima TaxID=339359 RepID=A0AAD5WQ47_9PEZI|nr:GMC oxidoreductase [Zalerion maritima]